MLVARHGSGPCQSEALLEALFPVPPHAAAMLAKSARGRGITHAVDEIQASSAALSLVEADEVGPRKADTGTKHFSQVPTAPRNGGVQAVVTSPKLGSPTNGPVRMRDLVMPEQGEASYRKYKPGTSEFSRAENLHWGASGARKNTDRAKKWAEAAASLNNPAAVAWCKSEGWNGMHQNRKQAHEEFLAAALTGDAGAACHLGAMLYEGGNTSEGATWLRKAAKLEHAPSIQLLDQWGLDHIDDAPEGEIMAAAKVKLEQDLEERALAKVQKEEDNARRENELAHKLANPDPEPVPINITFGQDDDDDDDEDEPQYQPEPEPEPEPELEVDPELHEMWMEVDADRSGTLDRGEIANVLKKMGLSADDEDVEDAMTGFDEDGNGTIEYDEFILWYTAVQNTGKLTAVAAEEAEAPAAELPEGEPSSGIDDAGERMMYYEVVLDEPADEPVSVSELKSMFKAGTINGDTRVWTDGMPDWAELSTTAYVS